MKEEPQTKTKETEKRYQTITMTETWLKEQLNIRENVEIINIQLSPPDEEIKNDPHPAYQNAKKGMVIIDLKYVSTSKDSLPFKNVEVIKNIKQDIKKEE